jgi:hypothetical protein
MADENETLRINISADGAKAGSSEVVRSLESIVQAHERTVKVDAEASTKQRSSARQLAADIVLVRNAREREAEAVRRAADEQTRAYAALLRSQAAQKGWETRRGKAGGGASPAAAADNSVMQELEKERAGGRTGHRAVRGKAACPAGGGCGGGGGGGHEHAVVRGGRQTRCGPCRPHHRRRPDPPRGR